MVDLVVAAPPILTPGLSLPGAEVVRWKGTGEPPRDDITVWVPAYVVGRESDDIRATLGRLPALSVVQLLTAGVEPWPALLPPGVTLCAGKSIHGGSTAELAVAMILAHVRGLPTYAEQQARRDWTRHDPDTVEGKHVLVLGAGDIGTRVAETLEVLGATVTLAARTRHTPLAEAQAMLPRVDVLVVALPLTPETTSLVDADWLSALPDGAVVVNIARGPILDTAALTAEVQRGRLRAALDVTDPEPLPADHPLWTLPGVILTPHVGGGASGWEARATRLVQEQVGLLRDGLPPRFQVSAGY